jgi:hypothetical protein
VTPLYLTLVAPSATSRDYPSKPPPPPELFAANVIGARDTRDVDAAGAGGADDVGMGGTGNIGMGGTDNAGIRRERHYPFIGCAHRVPTALR